MPQLEPRVERLRVEGVSVVLGGNRVLDAVDVAVAAGETIALLGPSGSGKSTLLRAIAGLEPLVTGRISLGGTDLANVPPHRRGAGLMFQDDALFPHTDVRGNVEFGLRMGGMPAAARAARVDEVLTLVGLGALSDRRVTQLSGGEQQRVALARTLAPRPRVLMLDEPLGSLDRLLHDRLLDDLRAVLRASDVPTLVVTHDHDEAMALADRVVLLRAGRVVQSGTPTEIWNAPVDEWVARFLGFGPVLEATIAGAVATTRWGVLPVGGSDGAARIVLRPDALSLADQGAISGVVTDIGFRGARFRIRVSLEGGPSLDVTVDAGEVPERGSSVSVAVAPGGVLVYPAAGGPFTASPADPAGRRETQETREREPRRS
ncbi:MAG: thiamine transport system ATP-binding protein [Actinomycetota bacterium]|nr:thiamine transport system ATP-binding protein [Actinomycetota bacterium]